MLFAAFLSFTAALVASGAAESHHEVTGLPGWDGPLPSRTFSGFGSAGSPPSGSAGEMHMHYLFVESEGSPEKDPVMVWYNGGPGATSLFGLFVEFGPLLLNADSLDAASRHFNSSAGLDGTQTTVPRLIRNENSWAKLANLLIVNSPPPVGFSFCEPDGPAGDGRSCGAWDDSLVARANHHFLTRLFNGPLKSYLGRELYLVGESYAGVYVPTIARELLADPRGIRLAGMAIGDGCLGSSVLCGVPQEPHWQVQFLHGHGQFSEELYENIQTTCSYAELRSREQGRECKAVLAEIQSEVGGYYPYGLYDECYWNPGNPFLQEARQYWGPSTSARRADELGVAAAENDYPCPGQAFDKFLRHPDVRAAMHVPLNSNFFSGDNGVGFDYTLSEADVRPIHLYVLRNTDMRVMVYNGDTDPGINSFVTQGKFVEYWREEGVARTRRWRPWTLDGKRQLAGYVVEYEGNWSYVTVRGSGHMVPEYKPRASLEMMRAFLQGESLKPYHATGSRAATNLSPTQPSDSASEVKARNLLPLE